MNIEEVYDIAQNQLKARRSKAIQDAESNKLKALKDAEYLSIANKIGELSIELGKAKYYNKNEKEIEKKYNEAKAQESKILKRLGLSNDDLKPKYTCSICEDKGVVDNKRCKCFNELFSSLLNKYNMNIFNPISFDDCEKIDKKILKTMQELVSAYPEKNKYVSVLITGDVGVGKTQLTQAVANAFLAKGLYTIFTSATTLNSNFLDYHKCYNENKNLYLHHYLECNVLIIDDLGTEPMLNNVTKEYLLMLVGERKTAKKLTIISTNLTADELIERYGERLVSRLLDYKESISIQINGEDLRVRNNKRSKND